MPRSPSFSVAVLATYPSDISGAIDPVTHKSLHPGTFSNSLSRFLFAPHFQRFDLASPSLLRFVVYSTAHHVRE